MNISCFCLFNEIDLLRLRLEYEYPYFDKIVIAEATRTHAGREKPLYFEKYRSYFAKYLDKLVYVAIDDMPPVDKIENRGWGNLVASEYRWHLEEHQRNCFLRGLNSISLSDSDWILVTDLDEFVDPHKFLQVVKNSPVDVLHYFTLADYRYTVKNPPVSTSWSGAFAVSWRSFRHGEPSTLRSSHAELLDRMHWDTPITNLKVIRRRWLQFLRKRKTTSEASSVPTKDTIRLRRGGKTVAEALKVAGIRKGQVHRNAGCHFSMMTGGYEAWLKLKIQNFSHAECEGNQPLEDTTVDHYEVLRNFTNQAKSENQYEWGNLDPGLPDFFRQRIRDFPILLRPQGIDSVAE